MKKTYTILLLSLLLTLFCCGCNNRSTNDSDSTSDQRTSEVDCYFLSASNADLLRGGENLVVATESRWWNGTSYKSESAKKEIAIEFCGRTFKGSYRCTRYDNYNSFATDYYDGEDGLEFGINADNGNIVYVNLKTLSFFEQEPLLDDIKGIEDGSVQIAKECASQLTDISEYTLVDSYATPYQPEDIQTPTMMFYTYTFVKTINDENSSAYISVQTTSKGNIASVVVGDIDAFTEDVLEQKELFKTVELNEVVLNKMKEITKDLDSPTFTIDKKYYSVTPAGELVVCVRATCAYSEKIEGEISEQTAQVGFEFLLK